MLKRAEEAFKKKDFSSAIKQYEGALKESSDLPPQTYLNLGSAYFQSKKFEKAQSNYLTAAGTVTTPDLKSVAYQQIGNIFSEKKEYKTAMEWYKKSLKTNPENEAARFNYELAYKLNQKEEEEKKKQENQNQKNQPKKDEEKNQKDQKDQQKKEGQDKEKNKGGEGKDKKDQEKGKEKGDDKKGPSSKGKDGKDGQERKGDPEEESQEKEGKDGKNGKEEQEDKEGKENSANKGTESNDLDPNAVRLDKKKLKETGLSEEQAKSLLKAMRQSEIKYLQQRRFGSKTGGSNGKAKW